MRDFDLARIKSRHEMIRYFDGWSAERKEELAEKKTRKPLVKTNLLETLGCAGNHGDDVVKLFARNGMILKELEKDLYQSVVEGRTIGFLERLRPRIVALYSTMDSRELEALVRRLVMTAPEIDHVWLSGSTFNVLWNLVCKVSNPNRYVRIVFMHDSIYDVDNPSVSPPDIRDSSTDDDDILGDDLRVVIERRAARFQLVDRVRVVKEKLGDLQKTYSPLHAISQLRFPSSVGKGGHDFCDNGKVTNRSDSFRDHRSHILYVTRIYEKMLGETEERVWSGSEVSTGLPNEFQRILGVPLVARFSEPLTQAVFEYWLNSTFRRPQNRFRLWGHPITLGPTKAHVYGLDKHLWRPLFLEITAQGCTAVVPRGTCGNTVHRLVTNIQRYLDPAAEFYLGQVPYSMIVDSSSQEVPYDLSK